MKISEAKEKLAGLIPEGVSLSDEVLEKVAGGMASDTSGEELVNALSAAGVTVTVDPAAFSKPDKGGLGTTQ